MELRDYLKVLRRRWAWIVVCTILGTALAVVFTVLSTKQYTSSATLFVTTTASVDAQSNLASNGEYSQQRVQSYADLVSSRALASQVISQLGLNLSVTELADDVSASVALNTVDLTISATNPAPRQAQAIAQQYAHDMAQLIQQLETPPGKTVAPIKATIVDPASLPMAPSSPRKKRDIGLGFLLGLLIGFGLAMLRQTLDTHINSADDLVEVLAADTPVLGAIPFEGGFAKHPLLTDVASHSPRVEAFRVLRTNLQFVDIDQQQKVFVVTSAVPNEGKTATAVNLAISLAQAGMKTLLIECDLRRPRATGRLDLDGAVGVTTVLLGRISFIDAIQHHASTGVDVLPSGAVPPNPAELLQSRAMKDLLMSARERYDVVIIDAPPLLPVTDAAVLAAESDGAVLVIRHGKTTREQLRHSNERLTQVEASLIGFVLNMVPSKGRGYGYGYGYGYAPDPNMR